MTQLNKVIKLLTVPRTIKEVAKASNILEPNVRRILGVGTNDGIFKRVSRGVYILKTKQGNYAYIETNDAVKSLESLTKTNIKFDAVFLDPAYYSKALTGGNRGIKEYKFILPDEFEQLMKNLNKLVYKDTHIYLMLSGARTAQIDMEVYLERAKKFFKVIKEGFYEKTSREGTPVRHIKGPIAPERLILLSRNGEARDCGIPVNLEYTCFRPWPKTSYQTEKSPILLEELIKQSTFAGDLVLDPFAGSGVTGEEALKQLRNVYLIESSSQTVKNYTGPRILNYIKAS